MGATSGQGPSRRAIAVFGGAIARPGDEDHFEALQLGRLLAESGFAVISGGYGGCMDAVSQGARQAGGEVIGITVAVFDRQGARANAWLTEQQPCGDLFERLRCFTSQAEGFVALPGAMGTLAEVAVTSNLVQIGAIPRCPVVLLGRSWERIMAVLRAEMRLRPGDLDHVSLAASAPEAMAILRRRLCGDEGQWSR